MQSDLRDFMLGAWGGSFLQRLGEAELLDIVSSIYDCVISPSEWRPTVTRIQKAFRWHNAFLASNSLVGNHPEVMVTVGVPEPYLSIALNPSYGQSIIDLWGGTAKVMDAPLEEPLVQSEMGDPAIWTSNKYFRDFVEPQGIVDAVTIGLTRDETTVATIAGGRHRSDGPFEQQELAGLRMLAPHLRRAVTIANLFEGIQSDNQMLSAALETSRAGIVLVDDAMNIIHANANAQAMLSAGDPIQDSNGRLALREEFSHDALAVAVRRSRNEHMGARGSGTPTRRRDGSPLLVHVLSLTGGAIRPGIVSRACAAVFVTKAPEPLKLPTEALGMLLDLTPAEVRVMEMAADCLSMSDIASRLGIASSTVKTHLLRVYEKTGTHKQADLARLARNLAQF